MPTDDNEPVYLDARVARTLALLTIDAPELIAAAAARHLDEIMVSPEVAAWLTGRSAKSIRAACDAGDLPHRGRRKRWIVLRDLSAWSGTPLDAERLAGALHTASEDCTARAYNRDRPRCVPRWPALAGPTPTGIDAFLKAAGAYERVHGGVL